METEIELGSVLPRGICDACMQAFRSRMLPAADGGQLVGGICAHNRTIAVLRHFPDGSVDHWRMRTPADERDLVEWMQQIAAVIAVAVAEKTRQRGNVH